MSTIYIQYEDVARKGQEIMSRAQDILDFQAWLNQVVNVDMPEMWQGTGYEDFVAKVNDKAHYFTELHNLVEEIGAAVISRAEGYRDWDNGGR